MFGNQTVDSRSRWLSYEDRWNPMISVGLYRERLYRSVSVGGVRGSAVVAAITVTHTTIIIVIIIIVFESDTVTKLANCAEQSPLFKFKSKCGNFLLLERCRVLLLLSDQNSAIRYVMEERTHNPSRPI